MKKLIAQITIILLIIAIFHKNPNFITPINVQALPSNDESGTKLIIVEKVNLEVKKGNQFVILEELIAEGQNPEEGASFPQLVNRSTIRINATYSTIIGNTESLVIHEFAIDVYEVIIGEAHNFNKTVGLVEYYSQEPADLILPPNSSKSEDISIDSLELSSYGTYKFVFRVQYHVLQSDGTILTTYFPQNLTFELVKSYPSPPYVIIYAFYFVSAIFIALIAFGIYGSRKYKEIE
ncbi:MAG: hypothetical protein ACFE9L_09795 [Candidatus Hodarchaeota archaeon]